MAINSSLILNNASWNGDIGFESLAEASCIIVKWLFISVYRQKKYHRSVRNVAMVLVAAIALSSSTYAWFVSNNTVTAESMSITAKTDSTMLLIKAGEATAKAIQTAAKSADNGLNANAALYPAAHETVVNVTAADAVANWYYKTADVGTASVSTGAKNTLSEFTDYVLVNEFSITIAKGTNTMKDLVVSDCDVTTASGAAEAVKVLIATDTNVVEFGVGENQTDATKLSGNITDSTVVKVKVYIYWDGNDADVYTTNFDKLKDTAVNIAFTATKA